MVFCDTATPEPSGIYALNSEKPFSFPVSQPILLVLLYFAFCIVMYPVNLDLSVTPQKYIHTCPFAWACDEVFRPMNLYS